MKLVVGLGNPGSRYERTRHNVGFRIVEHFAARAGIALEARRLGGLLGVGGVRARLGTGVVHRPGGPPDAGPLEVGILEPLTYMNRSGDPLCAALAELRVGPSAESILVCFDDLDLPFGRLRLRPRGGAGGHRGVAHLIERLGHGDFARLRFGVGRPPHGRDAVEHVLEPFSDEEEAALGEGLDRAVEAVFAVLFDGVADAMNRYNAAGSTSTPALAPG